jgi:hypothetical protein
MIRAIFPRLGNSSVTLCLIVAVFSPAALTAQSGIPGLHRIRWLLLDIVILPDSSSGLLFLVAPNPRAVQWSKLAATPVVSMGIDPITALQWATVARTLLADPSNGAAGARTVAPPLRTPHGPAFVLLAKNPKKSPPGEALIFLVSDSASHTQWKTFASAAQLDTLLTVIEGVARERQATWNPGSTSPASDDSVDVPVQVVFQPEPKFPGTLAWKGREGRVWMMYAIDSTGRSVTGSLRPLLSDDSQFTQAAIDALVHSKFKPALRHGRPVRQRVFQVIQFRQW